MADVHLPRHLTDMFPGAPSRLTVQSASVGDLLEQLDHRWPGMRDRLVTAGPAVREHINIFVDGERAPLTRPLTEASVVRIIPAITGG